MKKDIFELIFSIILWTVFISFWTYKENKMRVLGFVLVLFFEIAFILYFKKNINAIVSSSLLHFSGTSLWFYLTTKNVTMKKRFLIINILGFSFCILFLIVLIK